MRGMTGRKRKRDGDIKLEINEGWGGEVEQETDESERIDEAKEKKRR